MGENKGHGIKGPRHDNDVDEFGIYTTNTTNTASGKSAQGDRPQAGQQQQGNKQSGGQHASGGTPALDGLGARQGESAQDASQAWSQNDGDQGRGNR
ncbi:hypothetical protein IM543_15140 [Massilia sp. UMI-21]|nr:hypothetical protein IM543_15140 [Massilia sp. UMI-21]